MASSRSLELVGRVLGDRYRLLRPVGTGASAHVYAAEDVVLRRRVAVKVLHPGLAGDGAFGRRFRAEARAVASLHHPNILQVFDTGDDDGTPYVVTELLGGGSLRGLLDRGQLLTYSQATRLGADVASALDHAHRQGLVHRDIKPANLIFDEGGRVAVADFGLARALAEATWTEPLGGVVGTARYAAPEQVRGEPVVGSADVYSLALVLVEAVTGAVPFATESTVGSLYARLERPLRPGPEMGPLAEVLARAGTVSPDERISAGELAAELDTVAAGLVRPGPLPLPGPSQPAELRGDDAPTQIHPAQAPPARTHPAPPLLAPDRSRRSRVGPGGWDEAAAAPQPVPPGAYEGPGGAATTGAAGARSAVAAATAVPRTGRRRRRLWMLAAVALLVVGGAVGAVVATRPAPTHPVPALAGRSQAAAAAELAPLHLHLAVTSRTYDPGVTTGAIISQNPSGGRLREGQAVEVTVSLGPQPIPVPSTLAGKPQADAASVITTLGLTVGSVSAAPSMTVPQGAVISSSPAGGTLLPGQPVSLVVSSGKPFVVVPALAGPTAASFGAAEAALGAEGLPATETDVYNDTVTKGQVVTTTPGPGVSLRAGSPVTVDISLGPDVVTVPPVAGLSIPAATQALTGAGLVVVGVDGNPTASAVGSAPAAGSVVHRGTHVTITTA